MATAEETLAELLSFGPTGLSIGDLAHLRQRAGTRDPFDLPRNALPARIFRELDLLNGTQKIILRHYTGGTPLELFRGSWIFGVPLSTLDVLRLEEMSPDARQALVLLLRAGKVSPRLLVALGLGGELAVTIATFDERKRDVLAGYLQKKTPGTRSLQVAAEQIVALSPLSMADLSDTVTETFGFPDALETIFFARYTDRDEYFAALPLPKRIILAEYLRTLEVPYEEESSFRRVMEGATSLTGKDIDRLEASFPGDEILRRWSEGRPGPSPPWLERVDPAYRGFLARHLLGIRTRQDTFLEILSSFGGAPLLENLPPTSRETDRSFRGLILSSYLDERVPDVAWTDRDYTEKMFGRNLEARRALAALPVDKGLVATGNVSPGLPLYLPASWVAWAREPFRGLNDLQISNLRVRIALSPRRREMVASWRDLVLDLAPVATERELDALDEMTPRELESLAVELLLSPAPAPPSLPRRSALSPRSFHPPLQAIAATSLEEVVRALVTGSQVSAPVRPATVTETVMGYDSFLLSSFLQALHFGTYSGSLRDLYTLVSLLSSGPYYPLLPPEQVAWLLQQPRDLLSSLLPGGSNAPRSFLLYSLLTGREAPAFSAPVPDLSPLQVRNLALLSGAFSSPSGPYFGSVQHPAAWYALNATEENVPDLAASLGIFSLDRPDAVRSLMLVLRDYPPLSRPPGLFPPPPLRPGSDVPSLLLPYTDEEILAAYSVRAPDRRGLLALLSGLSDQIAWYPAPPRCLNDQTENVYSGETHGTERRNADVSTLGVGYPGALRCYQVDELTRAFAPTTDETGREIFFFRVPDWRRGAVDPVTGGAWPEEFSLEEIKELRDTLRVLSSRSGETDALLGRIEEGLRSSTVSAGVLREIGARYRRLPPPSQGEVRKYLAWLFFFSMWLRHWKGPGYQYPLAGLGTLTSCSGPLRDVHVLVQSEVRDALLQEMSAEARNFIASLPAVRHSWTSGETTYAEGAEREETQRLEYPLSLTATGRLCENHASDVLMRGSYSYITELLGVPPGEFDRFVDAHLPEFLERERVSTDRSLVTSRGLLEEAIRSLERNPPEEERARLEETIRETEKIIAELENRLTDRTFETGGQPPFDALAVRGTGHIDRVRLARFEENER